MRYLIALLFAATLRATPVTHDEARTYLVGYEGYRTQPYKDDAYYSVGIGHTLKGTYVYSSYSSAQIEGWFNADLANARATCREGVRDFDGLPQDIQLVCLGLVWSVGPQGFLGFRHFRLALSKRAYNLAAVELADSRWHVQTSRRRFTDAYQVLTAHGQAHH